MQKGGQQQSAQDVSNEQALIVVFARLPVPIVITKTEEHESACYVWHCLEHGGTAPRFDFAVSQALHFLIGRLGG